MLQPLTDEQARLLRTRAQQLYPRLSGERSGPAKVAQIVRKLCGVQAQDASAAALAVRARSSGLLVSDVERARIEDRSVVRIWLMRGTLHLIAAEDLGWILAMLAPIFIRSGRGRRARLGLDEDTAARGVRLLKDFLAQAGPATRSEIREELASHEIPFEGQATIHLIGLAALEGQVCYGPDRNGKETFVLLEEWIDKGEALPPEQAATELACRYLAAYGPSAPEDFAAWSGLTLGAARAAWKSLSGDLLEVKLGGESAWMLENRAGWLNEALEGRPILNLLPGFDPYLLGYRSRELALDSKYAHRIFPGGGILHPALLLDGRAMGRWRVNRHRDYFEVAVEPFEDLGEDSLQKLEEEVEDLAHYWGISTRLKIT